MKFEVNISFLPFQKKHLIIRCQFSVFSTMVTSMLMISREMFQSVGSVTKTCLVAYFRVIRPSKSHLRVILDFDISVVTTLLPMPNWHFYF